MPSLLLRKRVSILTSNVLQRNIFDHPFTTLSVDDEPLGVVLEALEASRLTLRSFALTLRTCVSLEEGTDEVNDRFNACVLGLVGPVSAVVSLDVAGPAPEFLAFQHSASVFRVAQRLLGGAGVATVALPPVTILDADEFDTHSDMPLLDAYMSVLSDARVRLGDVCVGSVHMTGSEDEDNSDEAVDARYERQQAVHQALFARPTRRLQCVDLNFSQPVLAGHISIVSEDTFDDVALAIAQSVNIQSVDVNLPFENLHLPFEQAVVRTFMENVFSNEAHVFSEGVRLRVKAFLSFVAASSLFDTVFRRIRAGRELVLDLPIRWEPSTVLALQHALDNSPALQHVELRLEQCDAPSPASVPLAFPPHVTSASLAFAGRVHASLLVGASFPGITELVVTVAPTFGAASTAAFRGLVRGAVGAMRGAPGLRHVTLNVEGSTRGLATRVGAIRGIDVSFPPAWASQVDRIISKMAEVEAAGAVVAEE